MKNYINKGLPAVLSIRHYLHQHPELSLEEHQTATIIANRLEELGYSVEKGVGGTGVTALLDSGKPGKTIGLRADMDALPLQEETTVPFKSLVKEKMHACGHDGHIATLLLVADVLRQVLDQFTGKIKFIFQPAEELGLGAQQMIDAGVLKHPPLDAIFGYHNLPTYPKNQVLIRSGCIMAGRMILKIKIKGMGGHASAPEKTIDPIYVGSCILQNLYAFKSRVLFPYERVVIAITKFNAGNAENIIPSEANLVGTIRFTSNNIVEKLQEKIKHAIEGIASAFDAEVIVDFPQIAPATINTIPESELVYRTAVSLFGNNNVVKLKSNIMASEDFAFFLDKIPGCFFLIGTGEHKPYLHNAHYLFEDEVIPIAAELLAKAAINYLEPVQSLLS